MEERSLNYPVSTDTVVAELSEALGQAGYRYALASVSIVRSLTEEIANARDQGLLAEDMFASYEESWRFVPPDGITEPRTLIVVAWQSLPVKLRFQMSGGALEAVVPPTYVYSVGRSRCLDIARSVLKPHGYYADWVRVPTKLLAVRTGLAAYGRNNLAYLPGLGSCVRLGVLCTDAGPAGPEGESDSGLYAKGQSAHAHAFMAECAKCQACSRACPTDCIPVDGTVIDAAHCLTEANENEGEWPEWVAADAHNCLVGCMRCQRVCPLNKDCFAREADLAAEFDREETELILSGTRLPDRLRARLSYLDLEEYAHVLARNLEALAGAGRPS